MFARNAATDVHPFPSVKVNEFPLHPWLPNWGPAEVYILHVPPGPVSMGNGLG